MNPLSSSSFFFLLSFFLPLSIYRSDIFLTFFDIFFKKLQIFKRIPNLPQNEHFALKCTSCSQMYIFDIFWHFLNKKIQIFENMPNLPQNENFALKCTSLLSNVHHCSQMYIIALKCTSLLSNVHHCSQMYIFDIFWHLKKTSNFRKHAKFATKWTFCSQMYIIAL